MVCEIGLKEVIELGGSLKSNRCDCLSHNVQSSIRLQNHMTDAPVAVEEARGGI